MNMKGKFKNKSWMAVIAAVILILILIFAIITVNNSKPKALVNTMFEDIKTGNIAKMGEYINLSEIKSINDTNEDKEKGSKEMKLLLEKMEYKIESSKINKNEAKVMVRVSNKDINTTLKKYFSTAFAEMLKSITSNTDSDDIEEKLSNYLREEYEKASEVTSTIQINLIKEENDWKVDPSEENGKIILNAILPGYLDYINNSNAGTSE